MLATIGPAECSRAIGRTESSGTTLLIGRKVTAKQVKEGAEPGGLRKQARKIQQIAEHAGYKIVIVKQSTI